MSTLDSLSAMGYPSTGVYHSFNGKIKLAGYDIIRVERAQININNNLDIYPEVGSREPTIYTKEFDVRGTLTRAYVNGVEMRLALGLSPSDEFDPGKIYVDSDEDNDIEPLLLNSHSNRRISKNVYPIKTKGMFEVNSGDNIPNGYGGDGSALYLEVIGLMINLTSLNIGKGGDPINIGPTNWIGEKVNWSIL